MKYVQKRIRGVCINKGHLLKDKNLLRRQTFCHNKTEKQHFTAFVEEPPKCAAHENKKKYKLKCLCRCVIPKGIAQDSKILMTALR